MYYAVILTVRVRLCLCVSPGSCKTSSRVTLGQCVDSAATIRTIFILKLRFGTETIAVQIIVFSSVLYTRQACAGVNGQQRFITVGCLLAEMTTNKKQQ